MRVVGNYGTSLLDMMNSNKSVKDVLNQKVTGFALSAQAKKNLEAAGISLDGSTSGSLVGSEAYQTIKESSEDLRTSIINLTNSKEESLFAKAQESGSTSDVVKEVQEFAKQYNLMLDGMEKMGGTANEKYEEELAQLVKNNKDKLEKVGVTTSEDGKLVVDSEVLEAASLDDLKAAFNTNADFTDAVVSKSIYIEANAMSAMYSSAISNYTNSASYSDSVLSNFVQSI